MHSEDARFIWGFNNSLNSGIFAGISAQFGSYRSNIVHFGISQSNQILLAGPLGLKLLQNINRMKARSDDLHINRGIYRAEAPITTELTEKPAADWDLVLDFSMLSYLVEQLTGFL